MSFIYSSDSGDTGVLSMKNKAATKAVLLIALVAVAVAIILYLSSKKMAVIKNKLAAYLSRSIVKCVAVSNDGSLRNYD